MSTIKDSSSADNPATIEMKSQSNNTLLKTNPEKKGFGEAKLANSASKDTPAKASDKANAAHPSDGNDPKPNDIHNELKAQVRLKHDLNTLKSIRLCDCVGSAMGMTFITSAIFMQTRIENQYKVYTELTKYFEINSTSEYIANEDITAHQDINRYFDIIINKGAGNVFFKEDKYMRISDIRITQRIAKTKPVVFPQSPLIGINRVLPKTLEISPFSAFHSTTETSAAFTTAGGVTYEFNKRDSFLQRGGYVLRLEQAGDIAVNNTEKFIEFRQHHEATLSYDFTVVNFELDFICSVGIANKIYFDGIVRRELYIHTNSRDGYHGTWAIVRSVIEGLGLIFYLGNLIFFFVSVRVHRDIAVRNKGFITGKCRTYASIGLSKALNVVHFLSFLFLFVMLITYMFYLSTFIPEISKIDNVLRGDQETIPLHVQDNLFRAGQVFAYYRSFATFALFFMFGHGIHLLKILLPSSMIFISTLHNALSHLIYFAVFFIIALLAFSLFSWVGYGRQGEGFHSLARALNQNFAFTGGIINTSLFKEMYEAYQVLTVFYFLLCIIIMRFGICKVIGGILLKYFTEAYQSYSYRKESTAKSDLLINGRDIKAKSYADVILKYSSLMNGIMDFFCCKATYSGEKYQRRARKAVKVLKKRESLSEWNMKTLLCREILQRENLDAKAEEKNKTELLNLNSNTAVGGDIESVSVINVNGKGKGNGKGKATIVKVRGRDGVSQYEEDYEFITRNAYFDSEIDYTKQAKYYESKYRRYFNYSLFFLFFMIVFTLMYLFNIGMPWREHGYTPLSRGIGRAELNSIKKINDFISKGGPTRFNCEGGECAFLGVNYLIKNTVLITVKRSKPSKKRFADRIASRTRVRDADVFDIMYLNKEDKRRIDGNGNIVVYDKYHTYKHFGGYGYTVNIADASLSGGPGGGNTVPEGGIDEYSAFVIVEIFLDNKEYGVGAYAKLIIKHDFGGYYTYTYDAKILKYDNRQYPGDVIKYIIEGIYALCFLFYVLIVLTKINEQRKNYDKWYNDIVFPMNIKIRSIRKKIKPEALRKIEFLVGGFRLIDLFMIFINIGLIYSRISFWINENQGYYAIKAGTHDIYEVRDIFSTAMFNKDNYTICGAGIIFGGCMKLTFLGNLNKYFSILIGTFRGSVKNIIVFIILLVLVQFSFVFYGHLIFGIESRDFHKVETTIKTCLKIAFGFADYRELYRIEKGFGAFFFFAFLVVVNLILLNLFVLIIYISYIQVKYRIAKRDERWNWMNVYLCCRRKPAKEDTAEYSIETEFAYDKMLTKYESDLLLHKEKVHVNDWIKHEIEQIRTVDRTLWRRKKQKQDIELAFKTTKTGKVNMFEDNCFKSVQENHFEAFNIYYLNSLLTIAEGLEDEVRQIEQSKKQLKKHSNYVDYERGKANGEMNNEIVRYKINELDENFLEMNKGGKMMYEANEEGNKENLEVLSGDGRKGGDGREEKVER